MKRQTILSALVIALVATGCGPIRAERAIGVEPPVMVDPPAPEQPPIAVEGGASGGEQPVFVEPDDRAVEAVPVSWDTAQVLDGGDRIELRFMSNMEPCRVLERIEIEETAESVTVTLLEGHLPTDEPIACPEVLFTKATVAHLDAPIGTRSLIDGAD